MASGFLKRNDKMSLIGKTLKYVCIISFGLEEENLSYTLIYYFVDCHQGHEQNMPGKLVPIKGRKIIYEYNFNG